MKQGVIACLAMFAIDAWAQNVIGVHMQGQPLIYTDAGKPNGCGIRIVGIIDSPANGKSFRSFDVSINVYSRGVAVGKVVGEVNVPTAAGNATSTRQPLFGAWLRSGDQEPVAPVGNSFKPSSEKGAYLFQAGLSASLDLLISILKQQEIQVGVRWQRDIEAIYTGTPLLQDDERRQVVSCVEQVFK